MEEKVSVTVEKVLPKDQEGLRYLAVLERAGYNPRDDVTEEGPGSVRGPHL